MATTERQIPKFQKRFGQLADKYPNKTDFAKALGITQQTVNYWINGERVPDAHYLKIIAEKTGKSVDWLLGISESETPDVELKALSDYTGLSNEAIDQLHREVIVKPKGTQPWQLLIEEMSAEKPLIDTVNCLLSTKYGIEFLFKLDNYLKGEYDKLYFNDHDGKEIQINLPIHCSNGRKASVSFFMQEQLENITLESLKDILKKLKAGES